MSHFIRASLFLTALNFLAGNIPGLMPQTSRLSGFLILLAWIGAYRPLKIGKSYLSLFSAVAILISFPLLLSESSFLFGISLCLFSLSMLSHADHPVKDIPVFLLTTVFYTVFVISYRFSPHLWYILQHISLGFSPEASAAGNKMTLAATALGMPIVISVLCYCISLFFFIPGATSETVEMPESEDGKKTKKRKKAKHQEKEENGKKTKKISVLVTIFALVGMNVVYLRLQEPLTTAARFFNKSWNPTPLDFQMVLLLLLLIAIYPVTRKIQFRELPLEFPGIRLKQAISALCLVFVAVLILAYYPKGHNPRGDIVFCDKGSNWAVPVYGKVYGQHSAGMFGMLPNYLKLRGYQTRIVSGKLRRKDLDGAGVIAVFNPVENFSGPEKQLIYKFIEDGGSLVVAGDHTDVSGVMGPINDLVMPFNITLNFDTALPIASGWVDSLEKRPHPITANIDEDHETSIWVGASLNISLPAKPVITGKLGWADKGNYLNKKRAFLGNYRRSSNEQLGDVVLVAESVYGKGKVLVFGDTSTFQNGVLTSGHPFLDRIFDWLSSRGDLHYPGQQFVFALLLLAGAGYLVSRMPCTSLFVLCLFAAHIPLWATQSHTAEVSKSEISKTSDYEIAYIDTAHNGRFSMFASAEESVWGISINLMRNRYIPLFMKNFSEEALSETRLFIVIAPTTAFSEKESDALKRFMENGGHVIWSVGWEEMEGSRSFLEKFSFSVDSVPLGPGEIEIGRLKAKFLEAWPIKGGSESKQIIAEKFGYPVIVYQPVGKGGLLVIGDSEFLHSRNIESYKNYDFKNIRFFKYLLDKIKT